MNTYMYDLRKINIYLSIYHFTVWQRELPPGEVNTEECKICYWPWTGTHSWHNDDTLSNCRLPFTTTMQQPSNWKVCITFDCFIILRLSWCYQLRLCFVEGALFTLTSNHQRSTPTNFNGVFPKRWSVKLALDICFISSFVAGINMTGILILIILLLD